MTLPLFVVTLDHPDVGYSVLAVCTSIERARNEVTASMRACDMNPENAILFDDHVEVHEGSFGAFWHITAVTTLDACIDTPKGGTR